MKKSAWKVFYRNDVMRPSRVFAGDFAEAFSEGVALARFHMCMVDGGKPEDLVAKVEREAQGEKNSWRSRPVAETASAGIF